MSLAEVGEQVPCSRQNVYKIEHAVSNPTLDTLLGVAHALSGELSTRLLPEEVCDLTHRVMRLEEKLPMDQLAELEAVVTRLEGQVRDTEDQDMIGGLVKAGFNEKRAAQVVSQHRERVLQAWDRGSVTWEQLLHDIAAEKL